MATPRCNDCGAALEAGFDFCRACGAGTPTADDESADEGPARRTADRNRAEAAAGVRGLRNLLLGWSGVFVLIGLNALIRGDSAGAGPPWISAALGLEALILAVAAFRLNHEPRFWTVAAAVFCTGMVVFGLSLDGHSALYWVGPLLGLWFSVTRAIQASAALRRYPGLVDTDPGPPRSPRSPVARFERQGGLPLPQRLILIAIAIVAVSGVLWLFVEQVGRSRRESPIARDELERQCRDFETAWREARFDDLLAPRAATFDRNQLRRFTEALARHGWTNKPPALAFSRFEVTSPELIMAYYEVEGRLLAVTWQHVRRSWKLAEIGLPFVVAGEPVDSTLDLFIAAWHDGDVESLGRFHHDARSRARAVAGFKELIARYERDGVDRRVRHRRVDPSPDGVTVSTLEIGKGSLELDWRWHPDGWKLHKVHAPR